VILYLGKHRSSIQVIIKGKKRNVSDSFPRVVWGFCGLIGLTKHKSIPTRCGQVKGEFGDVKRFTYGGKESLKLGGQGLTTSTILSGKLKSVFHQLIK
jgi:hypothetical protein